MDETQATAEMSDIGDVYGDAYRAQTRLALPTDVVILPADDHWCLQRASTRSICRATPSAIGALLQLFGTPRTLSDVETLLGPGQRPSMRQLIGQMLSCGLLVEQVAADAGTGGWELADLLFHRYSRRGGFAERVGMKAGYTPAPAACEGRPPAAGVTFALPPATLTLAPRLDRALELRRTTYGSAAPDLAALGALLAWTFGEQVSNGVRYRRYPSGGNLHSLRPFICTSGFEALPAGVWEYAPSTHCLLLHSDHSDALQLLLEEAAISTSSDETPPVVLLVLASDIGQVTAKYTGLAYSLIAKEVGAAMMLLSLVASALSLSCVPIGTGNSTLFAEACGIPELELPSVGELVLASRGAARAA